MLLYIHGVCVYELVPKTGSEKGAEGEVILLVRRRGREGEDEWNLFIEIGKMFSEKEK